ncbi:MAG: Fpg/Nei family DNA glycosylase, partial [Planctomycetota bacterium]
RRFGRLRLFTNDELWDQDGLNNIGPEPLEITGSNFVELCKSTRRMIKPALLDQTFIAGLGNIYADESLFASRIHPKRLTSSLSAKRLTELHGHIQRLLALAIRKMGTSVDSFSGINGQPGRFQKYLQVYSNDGSPCPRCGKTIVREKIGSRSAHYCRRCQRI